MVRLLLLDLSIFTMAANFHSDSSFAVAASARILSAMTVISDLMPASSASRPEGSSSSRGEKRDLRRFPGLPGSTTDSAVVVV